MKQTTCVSALLAGLIAIPGHAQEVVGNGEFIGTVTIGESRRGVQTDTAASVTVIDQEEIEARQATTLTDLLETVPNVNLVNGNTPQGGAVSIRGLGSQAGLYGTDGKISVVVDGIASGAEEIYRNGSMLALEPELFKKLTVTRGPSDGFRYSSGAIGGTIEAETKDASDFLSDGQTTALRQKLSYETNSDSVLTSTIFALAPNANTEILAFYASREAEGFADGEGNVDDDTAFDQTAFMLKGTYRLNSESSFTAALLNSEVPQFDVPYDVVNTTTGFANVDRLIEDETAYIEYNFASANNALINVTARLQFKTEVNTVDPVDPADTATLYQGDHTTDTVSFLLSNESVFNTGSIDHVLTAGIEIKSRERSSVTDSGVNDASAPGGVVDSQAVYIVNEMSFGNGLTLTPQVRYETQDLTGENNPATTSFGSPIAANGLEFSKDAFTGALGAKFDVTDSFGIFGTVAYNENLPILDDLGSPTFIEQSEKARTYEVGMSYDGFDVFTDGDSFKAKLTYFETMIWDGTTYRGIDGVELDGIELEASYANAAFYVDFNAGRTRGIVTAGSGSSPAVPGSFFSYTPADTIQLTLGKKFLDDQLDASIELTRAFSQDRTTATSGARAPTDAYSVFDASLGYTASSGPLEGVEFRGTVENLFDETYRVFGNERNAPGRNFIFSVAKTF